MYSTQKHSVPTVESLFIRYVSQNILGMLGISAYVLADTFFIAKAAGANGITALNLVLPVYSLIFAIGNMIGTGHRTCAVVSLSTSPCALMVKCCCMIPLP